MLDASDLPGLEVIDCRGTWLIGASWAISAVFSVFMSDDMSVTDASRVTVREQGAAQCVAASTFSQVGARNAICRHTCRPRCEKCYLALSKNW
jgi:hypothetical protein